jgi:TRAP-type C4-dicarboxylate transport system permease small subunit
MLSIALEKALRLVDVVARWAVWLGGTMMLFAAVMVSVDVLMRRFLGVTLGGADEISGYLFAVATSWAFAYVLLHRGNVRIDALYVLLPRRLCAVLDLIALLALGLFMAVLTHRAFGVVTTSIEMGARSVTPMRTLLAVPQGLWVAGLVLFQAAFVLVLLQTLVSLARGDLESVRRTAGVPNVDEELREKLLAGDARPGSPPTPGGTDR